MFFNKSPEKVEKVFRRILIIAPTRATCVNIRTVFDNKNLPSTLLMEMKKEEIFSALKDLHEGKGKGFGVVAKTGTGKTLSLVDISKKILSEDLVVDMITRESSATDYTWTCNVLIVTPGVFLNWIKDGLIKDNDLVVVDEIHQTSIHLELSLALAKRENLSIIWMSATIDPEVYSDYLNSSRVISCDAFDPEKKATVHLQRAKIEEFLSDKIGEFISQNRGVAVFVPTRALAEELSESFSKKINSSFYHGGESAEKILEYLEGRVPKPFIIFMTNAGSSSLNVLGLNTVVIMDEMYKEIVHNGVSVLQNVYLGENELLQMGGRVNGRAHNAEIFILTRRNFDFHELHPTVPDFVLGGDLSRVALTCAKLEIDISELDLIGNINIHAYNQVVVFLREQGIIHSDCMKLTPYGLEVEAIPVDARWAELIVNAKKTGNSDLLRVVIFCSSIDSLYSLVRKEFNPSYNEFKVKRSDHLTSYNIVASALKFFGRTDRFREGLEYVLDKNIFPWSYEKGLVPKAIKEVFLAVKSIYHQLNIDLPEITEFSKIESDDVLVDSFIELLMKVQSLDFVSKDVCNEEIVFSANCSSVGSAPRMGIIRHWKDQRGYSRASMEGTEISKDLLEAYAKKSFLDVRDNYCEVDEDCIRMKMNLTFARQIISSNVFVPVSKEEIPDSLHDLVERAFIKFFFYSDVDVAKANREVMEKSRTLSRFSKNAITTADRFDVISLYEKILLGKKIFTLKDYYKAVEEGVLNSESLKLNLNDFVSVEIQERIAHNNPLSVLIDGESFVIEYNDSYEGIEALIYVSEKFARKTLTDKVFLPDGRIVKVYCTGIAPKESFSELVSVLEANRIKNAWAAARMKYEVSFDSLEKALSFSHDFAPVLITKKNGEDDLAIYGYLYFCKKGEKYEVHLSDSSDFSIKELEKNLKLTFLEVFNQSLKDLTKNVSLSDEISKLFNERINSLKEENLKDLTCPNILERINSSFLMMKNYLLGDMKAFREAESLFKTVKKEFPLPPSEKYLRYVKFKDDYNGFKDLLSEVEISLRKFEFGEVQIGCEMISEYANTRRELEKYV
jgi:hypothetical protein